MARRQRTRGGRQTARDFPRTARLNELFREIIADELEYLDASWTAEISITGVEVDADLRRARVFFDNLDAEPEADEEAAAQLASVRGRLQSAIAHQARIRRTPELTFVPDPAVRRGERIDEILGRLGQMRESGVGEDEGALSRGPDDAGPPGS